MSSNPQSIFLRVHYPEKIGLLCDDSLDQFLTSLQRSQPLLNYTCTLVTLMTPTSQTTSKDVPSLYSKLAPAYALGGSGDLEPVLLAELIFVTDLPVSEVTSIIAVVDDLIKKQLLSGRPQVGIRILTMSLSSGVAKYVSSEETQLPLQHYNHPPSGTVSEKHFYIVVLTVLYFVVLLLLATYVLLSSMSY